MKRRGRKVVRAFAATFVLGIVVLVIDDIAAEQRRARQAFAVTSGYAKGGRWLGALAEAVEHHGGQDHRLTSQGRPGWPVDERLRVVRWWQDRKLAAPS